MARHLALATAVRHHIGSAELGSMLNNFGHCISHTSVLEQETAVCHNILQSTNLSPVFLQTVMLSHTFVGTTLIYRKKPSQVQVQHAQHMASSYRKCQQRLQVWSSSKLPTINHNQGAGEELTIGHRSFHHALQSRRQNMY